MVNLSASGAFLYMMRSLTTGENLNIEIPLPIGSSESRSSSQLLTEGMVVRKEPHTDGECGIAVHFRRHRFVQQEQPGAGLM